MVIVAKDKNREIKHKNKEKKITEWKKKREKYKGLDIIPKPELRKLYQTYRNKIRSISVERKIELTHLHQIKLTQVKE